MSTRLASARWPSVHVTIACRGPGRPGHHGPHGRNAARFYHSPCLDDNRYHDGFLYRAQGVGLNVMPDYHTYGDCPHFDCYDT